MEIGISKDLNQEIKRLLIAVRRICQNAKAIRKDVAAEDGDLKGMYERNDRF